MIPLQEKGTDQEIDQHTPVNGKIFNRKLRASFQRTF
jgi:hypothetical protein